MSSARQSRKLDAQTVQRALLLREIGSVVASAKRDGATVITSLEAARNLLTPSRLALLRAIRNRRPGSIYELAKIVSRDLKNVQQDLRILERHGLVRMTRRRGVGKRKVRIPRAMFGAIQLKIAI